MLKRLLLTLCFLLSLPAVVAAQVPNPTTTTPPSTGQAPSRYENGMPVFTMNVVRRDIPAINYLHRSGATKIGFMGTQLDPTARGSAEVESGRGRIVIHARFEGLQPANSFSPEFFTYVIWAISVDGRAQNLGEVLPQGSKNEITVETDLQSFGLIVTAEPYFAVSEPSDAVILENYVLKDKTVGIIEPIIAHYSLLPRGAYTQVAAEHSVLNPITRNEHDPLELYEARNAIRLARYAGAEHYANDIFSQAVVALQNAEDLNRSNGGQKQVITFAREAVQRAEDARISTLRKMAEEKQRNTELAAQQSQEQAQQSQLQAEQAKAQAAEAAAERARADAERREAEAAAAQARSAQQAAEQSAQQAAQQTAQMRERLRQQLNQVLNTRETARGLIVNLSDVLFDFNKYTLKPDAREKLAKVSGILLAYPDLKIQVEGYTDSIGSDEYNQKLSEQRAGAVRDYLVSQSVNSNNVTSAGYGKTNPVADNSTNAGRAQNRRVQLVVSGQSIGLQSAQPGGNDAPADDQNQNMQPQQQQPQQQQPQPQQDQNPSGQSNPPQQ